jgi:hypothetical protein
MSRSAGAAQVEKDALVRSIYRAVALGLDHPFIRLASAEDAARRQDATDSRDQCAEVRVSQWL